MKILRGVGWVGIIVVFSKRGVSVDFVALAQSQL